MTDNQAWSVINWGFGAVPRASGALATEDQEVMLGLFASDSTPIDLGLNDDQAWSVINWGIGAEPRASGLFEAEDQEVMLGLFAFPGLPAIQVSSSKRLPLGEVTVVRVRVAATSTRALPLGRSSTARATVGATSVRRLPLGRSNTVAVTVKANSAKRLPLGKVTVVNVRVAAASTKRLPLGGSSIGVIGDVTAALSTAALPLAGTSTVAVRVAASSSKRLPLTGAITTRVTVGATSVRRLPLGGHASAAHTSFATSVKRLPLGRVNVVRVRVAASSSKRLPLSGAIVGAAYNVGVISIARLSLGGLIEVGVTGEPIHRENRLRVVLAQFLADLVADPPLVDALGGEHVYARNSIELIEQIPGVYYYLLPSDEGEVWQTTVIRWEVWSRSLEDSLDIEGRLYVVLNRELDEVIAGARVMSRVSPAFEVPSGKRVRLMRRIVEQRLEIVRQRRLILL